VKFNPGDFLLNINEGGKPYRLVYKVWKPMDNLSYIEWINEQQNNTRIS
jgi:hypothetical protein